MTNLNSTCPICDVSILLDKNVEESEIITCKECKTRLVVESNKDNTVILSEAPKVEEDWGQ